MLPVVAVCKMKLNETKTNRILTLLPENINKDKIVHTAFKVKKLSEDYPSM